VNFYSKISATSSHFSNIGKQSRQGKKVARSSQKEAALPAKGSNSIAGAKDKTPIKCQERNCQCQQVDQLTPPTKPPPQCTNILGAAGAAAREQLKADLE
jgi:hypothetical protein